MMPRRRHAWSFVAVLAAILVVVTNVGAADDPGAPANVKAIDGGFEFDVPMWKPKLHGEPTRLVARYSWAGQGPRTVDAKRQKVGSDEVWHLEFPDQPSPDEMARLELRYEFKLGEGEQKTIREAARKVVRAILRAAGESSKGGPDKTASNFSLGVKSALTSTDADTLRKFAKANGQADALTLLLDRMGLKGGEAGEWSVAAAGRLVDVAEAAVKNLRVAEKLKAEIDRLKAVKVDKPDSSSECAKIAGDDLKKLDTAATARAALVPCADALSDEVDKRIKDPKAKIPDAEPADVRKAAADLKKLVDQLDDRDKQEDLSSALTTLHPVAGSTSHSYWAVRISIDLIRKEAAAGAWQTTEDGLVADVDAAIESALRQENGSTLVAGRAKPRRYDISTGVIYVGGIHDVVVPMLISICAWDGCLKANDVAWAAHHGWGRAWSFDAGVRVKTLDSQDPRQSDDKLSFAVGLSFNPVTVLRISAGGYAFENTQTKNWNVQPYAGITLNVLNAAEVLGGLGLGSQIPTTTPIGK